MSRVLPFQLVISNVKQQREQQNDPLSVERNNNNNTSSTSSNNNNGQTGIQSPKFAKSSPSPMPKHVINMSKSAVMTPKGPTESHDDDNNVGNETPIRTP